MKISVVQGVLDLINAFPMDNGISFDMSPGMIVERKQKLDMNQNRIEFGAYALVYLGTSNTMKKRSIPAIALKASNNS